MPAQEREELSRRQMQYALKLKREVHDQKNQAALQQARLEKEKVAQQARREKEQTVQQTRREKEHAAPQADAVRSETEATSLRSTSSKARCSPADEIYLKARVERRRNSSNNTMPLLTSSDLQGRSNVRVSV
jgi:hypothetical protein